MRIEFHYMYVLFIMYMYMAIKLSIYLSIYVWNKLSTDCVHASSVNMFKNKIDKYLAKAGYT